MSKIQHPLNARQRIIHDKLQTDLQYFCRKLLLIKQKEGGAFQPFVWNKAQEYLHERIEDQLRRTGKVRIFVLKGRQQGISTYTAARYYRNATRRRGRNVFILSHIASTTETLFQMVDRFHENIDASAKPETLADNSRRLIFENGSQYVVGTAGSGSIGRGDTNQYFHGSEVAFYEKVGELGTGVMQSVSDLPGTEIILESTANGMGNYFHRGCMDALAGEGEYELVFIPWYWQPEYRAPLRPDFHLTDEEIELKETYGLDDEQLQWRRNKIAFFKTVGERDNFFQQEYPFTVREAFMASGESLIDMNAIATARKSKIRDDNAPLVLGVDPGPIHDRTTIAWRKGRYLIKVETFQKMDQMELAGIIANRIKKYNVKKVFIDVAEGRGCVSRLSELGFGGIVTGIPFAMKPNDSDRYANKRAEMAGLFKEWVEDPIGVRMPDDELLETEIGAVPAFETTSNGRLQLTSKDKIKKEYGRSPDLFDACILTFAQPVRSDFQDELQKDQKRSRKGGSPLRTRRRVADADKDVYDDDETGWSKVNKKRLR